jgi:hypothetical protein
MLSGVVYGFSALSDGIIKKIKNKVNKSIRVIATGGNIRFISRYCTQFDRIDPDLTLKGLNFIYRDTLTISARGARLQGGQGSATLATKIGESAMSCGGFCGEDLRSGSPCLLSRQGNNFKGGTVFLRN